MNNFLDTNSFEHFLNFISLEKSELYQITEPTGFDAANFVVKQNDSRYSRDIIYGNDIINLKFYDANVELSSIEQVQDVDGRTSFYLDYGLNWILETYKRFGFEGKIEYILKKEGVLFTTGLLDMANPDTDGETYFGCSVIQSNQVANYKKHEDTIINLFSTKNTKNETITPAQTFKFLRKAVPIFQKSEINVPENYSKYQSYYGLDSLLYNPCINIISSDVENTIIPATTDFYLNSGYNTDMAIDAINNKKLLVATKRMTDIKIVISDLNISVFNTGSFNKNTMTLSWGNNPVYDRTIHRFYEIENDFSYVNKTFEYTIPVLEIGEIVWFYFSTNNLYTLPGGTPVATAQIDISNSLRITITANSFSLNTVVKGVRYIDMMKQCSKFINNLPINAPHFDVGGEFYDQVCYNRALISQNTDKPFTTTFNNIMKSTQEVNCDFEIKHNEIFQGQYADFYKNEEIGVFRILPSERFKENWNEKYKINLFSFGYKTFEQNRLTSNTTGDVHTESEWIIPNLMVENKKPVEIDLIRSAFSQQVAVDLEIKKPQTADENDDKVYIIDIIPLPEGSFYEFSAQLQMQISNEKLNIFNKKSDAAVEESIINWNILGFNVGDNFEVTSGQNIGVYNVVSFTQTILVLSPVGFIPEFTGDAYIAMKYYYNDVLWQTRTNEDFIVSGNTNLENYPNLKYTIRRNMFYWESYLRTACLFNLDKTILNSFFKNDPALESTFNGGINYIEKGEIPVSTLRAPLLTPKTFDIVIKTDFNQIKMLLEILKITRGFIRAYNIEGKIIKGYIKDLDYTWSRSELKLTLEEKWESETLMLTFSKGILTVNDVNYDLSGNVEWWKLTNEYFVAFDANNIPICNRYRFDKVNLNGTIYDSEYELLTALQNL